MGSGRLRPEDYEYVRHGVCNIFMANEPLRGKRCVRVTDRKTKRDWAVFLKELADVHYPSAFYEVFDPEEAKRLWDRSGSSIRPSMAVG